MVVCAFNEEQFIGRCLRSLAAQSFEMPIEVVVVDDASTDRTVEVVRGFADFLPVRIVQNASNRGIGFSSSKGVMESVGRFVVRVDADDFVSEHFLNVLHLAVSTNRPDEAARCDYVVVDRFGNPIRRENADDKPIACGIMMSRESVFSVGLYETKLRVGEDVEFEARFSERFPITRVPIPLYRYRSHDNNSSGGPQ